MAHRFNRSAFDAGRDAGSSLLSLYCSLVVVELALKDSASQWRKGHAVQDWLNELGDAGLTALTYQLAAQLQVLTCTDRTGSQSVIALNTYPDLRYLRHETDYPGQSTNEAIEQASQILDEIRLLLHNRGIL